MKKVLLILSLLVLVGAGALYFLKGKSQYDPAKYTLSITPEEKPFGVGSRIDFVLPDQFGKAHKLDPQTRTMVFAFTKATGHIIKEALADTNDADLQKQGAVVVADISGMPTVIQNMFALPDLRKSAYTMLLIYDKQMAARLKEGQATDKVILVRLKDQTVQKIEHAQNAKELLGKLGL